MSAVENARAAWAMLEGRAPWRGYDALILTFPSEDVRARRLGELVRLFAATPLRLVGVVERERRGNLGGTLAAWRAAGVGGRVAMLHDAGAATRTGPLVEDGTRGGILLGGAFEGVPLRLLHVAAAMAMPFAATTRAALDVFWVSQLALPGLPWEALPVVDAPLVKLGVPPPIDGDPRDLGVLAPGAFHPRGSLDDPAAWVAGHAGALWDLGGYRLSAAVLAELLDADPTGDVDAALTPRLAREGRLGVASLGPGTAWRRLRRPEELAREVDDPALRAALRLPSPSPVDGALPGVAPDPRRALDDPDATRALFAPIVAACDRLDAAGRDEAAERLFSIYAALGEPADPDRRRRIAANRPLPAAPRRIALLSRVTLGADVAVTSVIARRLRARWPDAELHLVGGAQAGRLLGLPSHDPRYPRSGTLAERLAAGRRAATLLEALDADLVVGADSRIDQLGTLQVAPEARTVLLETLSDGRPLWRVANDLCDDWLGRGHAAPSVDVAPSPRVRRRLALKLDTGGVAAKSLGGPFERALLDAVVARGWEVVLDRGVGDERAHADALARDGVALFEGDLPAWAALVASAEAALSYDSVGGHLAACEKRGAPGTPALVLFAGQPHARFAGAWAPFGARAVVDEPPLATALAWLDAL